MTINLREGRKSDSQNFCIILLKMSSSQQKITSNVKKQESMSPTQNKNEISLQKLPEEPTQQRLENSYFKYVQRTKKIMYK